MITGLGFANGLSLNWAERQSINEIIIYTIIDGSRY